LSVETIKDWLLAVLIFTFLALALYYDYAEFGGDP
jgi:hypothetical protein